MSTIIGQCDPSAVSSGCGHTCAVPMAGRSICGHLALQPACCCCARLMWNRCLQAMIVLLTMLTRTSVVDATHVWEQLARQNASTP